MTPPTKSLDETAGKQPWSESGLSLLNTLQSVVISWQTPVNEQRSKCTKPGCAFCYWVERTKIIKPILNELTLPSKFNSESHCYLWTPNEMALLLENIDRPICELDTIIPTRGYAAIMNKRWQVRNKLGLPPLPRGGWRES